MEGLYLIRVKNKFLNNTEYLAVKICLKDFLKIRQFRI